MSKRGWTMTLFFLFAGVDSFEWKAVPAQDGRRDLPRRQERNEPLVDPVFAWNTFYGGRYLDVANGIDVDGEGNIYVVGEASPDFGGAPVINPHAGGGDAFVAKLAPNGEMQWVTYMGSADIEVGREIAVSQNGNI